MPAKADQRLVGREQEFELLKAALAAEGSGAVVHGPVGVGKSRLAREALAAVAGDGAQTVWVQATRSAAQVPLGAFAGVLGEDVRSDDQLALLGRAVGAIIASAGEQRVVVAVDDAHALDPVSAALVLELATGGAAKVLVTVRDGEERPDAITSLWKDAGAVLVPLAPMSESECAALAESIAGGPMEEAARSWVHDLSAGNALYVRELVTGAREGGALTERGGLLCLTGHPAVSASLSELVNARMVGIGESEREAIELLAIGEPLGADELMGLVGSGAVERLERRGMIRVEAQDSVRLAHPLYGEAVAGSLGALRGRTLRRRLAAVLGARSPMTANDALRVTRWLIDSGEPIGHELLLNAANAATQAGDSELGAELARRAMNSGAGIEATLALGQALSVSGRPDEADEVLAKLDLATIEDIELAIAYVQQRASVLFWGLRRPEEARALVRAALESSGDHEWARRLAPLRSLWASSGVQAAEYLEITQASLADPELEPAVRRQLEPAEAIQLYFAGRGREAFAALPGLELNIPLDGYADEFALLAWLAIGPSTGEDPPLVRDVMTDVFRRAIRAGDHGAAGLAALALAQQSSIGGRHHDSARWTAEAERNLEQHNLFALLPSVHVVRVGIAAMEGDFEGASAAFERYREAVSPEHHVGAQEGPLLASIEARMLNAGGDRLRARSLLMERAERFRDQTPLMAVDMFHDAMRYGEPASRVAERVAGLEAHADSAATSVMLGHIHALAASDAAALLAVAGDLERIERMRMASEAAAEAARVYLEAGREDSARRAFVRSQDLFAACQGGRPPVVDGLGATAVGLTKREESIVSLVRQGLSNAEIADRLVLSVRTVESHVYRASQKLGVSDRRDL
jgi:DNA-binding CsgD family transcriptional regulator